MHSFQVRIQTTYSTLPENFYQGFSSSNQTFFLDHVKVRLQAIQDYKPPDVAETRTKPANNEFLLKWLQRMQFKMGQIELQASNVTQFFTV